MPETREEKERQRPAQHQSKQPGRETKVRPAPVVIREGYVGSGKLQDKVAIVTGGDSGIGRAVAVHFAREGADVVIGYFDEHDDAKETLRMVAAEGRHAVLVAGDVGVEAYARRLVREARDTFGKLDIVVNNAAEQHPNDDPDAAQVERTFRTNVFGAFHLVRAALPHLKEGASILFTSSVVAFRGSAHLLDYAATKGALVAYTRSLAAMLAAKGIRVNGVAPGPIWTPLIPSSFPREDVATFGSTVPLGRAGEPSEVAPAFVFLASEDASYITGQFIHPNGGEMIGT